MPPFDAIAIPGFREPFCSLSHLAAAIVFAVLSWFLIVRGRTLGARLSLGVLALTTVVLLTLSGVYHLLSAGTAREVMHRLDVASVFLMIAGTMTPIHYLMFQGTWRWVPLVIAWSLAIIG
ncbi:MAG TPA: hemolysin III family protein, partial [Pirellulaceae bacterium]